MATRKLINSPDLTGQKFGRLTVIERGYNKRHSWFWRCACECGSETTVQSTRLRTGYTKSCGCLFREAITTHGQSRTRTYRIWAKARRRCQDPKDDNYANYGGRGIRMCAQWQNFEGFHADMGDACGLTLECIDVNGDYGPTNCKWIPKADQNRNTRRTKRVMFEGVEMLLADALREIRRRAK